MGRPQRPALVLAFATPHLPLRPWHLTLRAWDLPLRARPGVAPMPTSPTPSTTPLNIWLLRLVIPANAGSAVGFDTPGSTRSRPNAQALHPHTRFVPALDLTPGLTPPLRFFIPAALGSSSDDCMLIIWRLRACHRPGVAPMPRPCICDSGLSSRRMPAPPLDLPLRARPGVAQMLTAPHPAALRSTSRDSGSSPE